jgi:ribose transport system ATP-binding protein
MTKSFSLSVADVSKSFGPTRAVIDVSLDFRAGEIHGLIGENGSGKSTLLSMIAGIHTRDKGHMLKGGQPYDPVSPAHANEQGVSMVVQELGLVDGLTVAENIFLGKTDQFANRGVINLRKMHRAAEEAFAAWGISQVPLDVFASSLTVEEKKLVELVRALSTDPDVLILDEITAAFSHNNRTALYKLLAKLKAQGKLILFVSHNLPEALQLCDRLTVLKDGEKVDTLDSKGLTEDELKRLMVGREIKETYFYTPAKNENAEPVLVADGITVDGVLHNVSFELRRGEVLGLGGLSDSGIHELGKVLFGLTRADQGQVIFADTGERIDSLRKAINSGIAYVPKDRDTEALMVRATIEDNLCLPSVDAFVGPLGFLSPRKRKKFAGEQLEAFEIKASGIRQAVNQLSGGNRQKVSLASWLSRPNKIIILDSPTRGVDVGITANIYKLIAEVKQQGIGIILISDELPELIGCSDRILIMKNGAVARIFERAEGFSENSIVEVMI